MAGSHSPGRVVRPHRDYGERVAALGSSGSGKSSFLRLLAGWRWHTLEAFQGTVLAVTHDRWLARSFDKFVVFGADGNLSESDGPVWDETRVGRTVGPGPC